MIYCRATGNTLSLSKFKKWYRFENIRISGIIDFTESQAGDKIPAKLFFCTFHVGKRYKVSITWYDYTYHPLGAFLILTPLYVISRYFPQPLDTLRREQGKKIRRVKILLSLLFTNNPSGKFSSIFSMARGGRENCLWGRWEYKLRKFMRVHKVRNVVVDETAVSLFVWWIRLDGHWPSCIIQLMRDLMEPVAENLDLCTQINLFAFISPFWLFCKPTVTINVLSTGRTMEYKYFDQIQNVRTRLAVKSQELTDWSNVKRQTGNSQNRHCAVFNHNS